MEIKQCRMAARLMLAACISGCGGPTDVPPLGTVHGTLTVDGKPEKGVCVRFSPKEGGRSSTGTTDGEGHFKLAYSRMEYGAKVGPHDVTIFMAPLTSEEEEMLADSGEEERTQGLGRRVDKLSESSIKQAEVKPGENEINLAFP